MRILYRTQQFCQALNAQPCPEEIEKVRQILSPQLLALFSHMQSRDQAHALRVFNLLLAQGETDTDLLAAALLHDVGKCRLPLQLWERIAAVLGRAFFPARTKEWGAGSPQGWHRPFVIAEQHPAWGAEMAAHAGASPLLVMLIRDHQEHPIREPATLAGRLLSRLQQLDDNN